MPQQGWAPELNNVKDPSVRAVLASLARFLNEPTFVNGINLGDGSTEAKDATTGAVTPVATKHIDSTDFP